MLPPRSGLSSGKIMLRAAVLLALIASPATAEVFVNNPGFCNATDGEQELAGTAYLTAQGIEAHWASCYWTEGGQTYAKGLDTRLTATCDDGARQWTMTASVSVNNQGRVQIWADGVNPLPEYYFPCSAWGYKNP